MSDNVPSVDDLEKAKQEALDKLKEIELLQQKSQAQSNTSTSETQESKEEPKATSLSSSSATENQKKTPVNSKEKDKEKVERILDKKEKEKEQLKNFEISISNRSKGKKLAEPGNTGIKHTHCEVFVFLVDDNELQLKVLQEQFKNTRSFKKTKTFTNGKDLLNYIKNHKFPKNSIFLVIMDYFLEDSDDVEAQNGIAVMKELKEYDPNIEVIMLSSHADVDIATSASYFGAVTFIQKGKEAFNKIINNMVWAIHEQEKIRKKADTKKMIKIGIWGFVAIIVTLLAVDYFSGGALGVLPVINEPPALPPGAPVK